MLRRLVQAVCGARCGACGVALAPGERGLCSACARELAPRTTGYCPACGALYPAPSGGIYLCGACRREPRPWDSLYFSGVYDGLLRRLVLDYKFTGRIGRGRLLQRLLREACQRGGWPGSDPAEAPSWSVVPIPLHPARLRERGFNQSLEVARGLAASGACVDAHALERHAATRPQVGLSAAVRRENVRGAFGADAGRVAGRNILLVDDILTTGGTLEAATRALERAGAARVDVAVLARTPEA